VICLPRSCTLTSCIRLICDFGRSISPPGLDLSRLGTRLIKNVGIDLIVSHGSTDSWIVAIAGHLSRKRPVLIRERHNLFPIRGWLSRWQHRVLFDHVVAISESVEEYLNEIGVPTKKIYRLHDTVNIGHFNSTESLLRKNFKILSDYIIVGLYADLTLRKGVYDFAEAAVQLLKKHDNIYIVFAGSYKTKMKNEIDALFRKEEIDAYDRIIWTGRVDDAATVLKDFDVYIYPSHSEGLGTVIIEGMASKTSLVVYDKKPMNRLVKNGQRGFAVPFKDTAGLAEAASNLIQNATLRRAMSDAAFNFVSTEHSDEKLLKDIKILLENLDAQ